MGRQSVCCDIVKVKKGYTIVAKIWCYISESSFQKDNERFDFESPLFKISFQHENIFHSHQFSFVSGKHGYFSWTLSGMKNHYFCWLASVVASPPVRLADLFLEMFYQYISYIVTSESRFYKSLKKKKKSLVQGLLASFESELYMSENIVL